MTLTIEEGIYYLLANNAAVAAIVGDRIYPIKLPQDPTLPAITYQLITPDSMIAHDGMSGTGIKRYQITGFALSPDEVVDLIEAIRICMTCYKGTIGAGANTIVCQVMLPAGGYESNEPEIERYMRALDFIIWHNEPVS